MWVPVPLYAGTQEEKQEAGGEKRKKGRGAGRAGIRKPEKRPGNAKKSKKEAGGQQRGRAAPHVCGFFTSEPC